jgi:choline dehydrogenase-like flavoprotein
MFDYVIVGAGSAGCVLASRLGEDPDARIAVIEAGPPDSEAVIHMPLAFRQLWESRFDWGLWSEREPGLGDRRASSRRSTCRSARTSTTTHSWRSSG